MWPRSPKSSAPDLASDQYNSVGTGHLTGADCIFSLSDHLAADWLQASSLVGFRNLAADAGASSAPVARSERLPPAVTTASTRSIELLAAIVAAGREQRMPLPPGRLLTVAPAASQADSHDWPWLARSRRVAVRPASWLQWCPKFLGLSPLVTGWKPVQLHRAGLTSLTPSVVLGRG